MSKFVDNTIALQSLCPNAEFIMYDNDYSKVVWIVQPALIPTAKELSDELKRLILG
jgi:hypothetical protein